VTDVGGGMVEYVSIEDFAIKEQVTAREEAGTPNIPGSIAMGLIAEALMAIGMDTIAEAEHALTRALLARLEAIPEVEVYGSTDLEAVPRAGVVSFNVRGMPHGLVAAYLNDFHNIAVRNGCFCAQPYVKALLQIDAATEKSFHEDILCGDRRHLPGMVRASLGPYSTADDVEALGGALEALVADRERITALYGPTMDGTFLRVDGAELPTTFSVCDEVRWHLSL
jgi:selenocysteine lyase/cysteine desulfurase